MILQTPSKQGEKRKSLRRSAGLFNLDAAAAGLDPEQESPLNRAPSRKRHQPLNESMIRHWRSNVANELDCGGFGEEEAASNPRASTATLTPANLNILAPTFEASRPLQTAFGSSGLVSKQHKPISDTVQMPETPCKRRPESFLLDVDDSDTSRLLWQSPFSEMTRHVQRFSLESPTRPLTSTPGPTASSRLGSGPGSGSGSASASAAAARMTSDASTMTPRYGLRRPGLSLRTPRSSPSTFLSQTPHSPCESSWDLTWGDASRDVSHGTHNTADTSIQSMKHFVSDIVLQERFESVTPIGTGEFSCVWSVVSNQTRFAVKRTKKALSGLKQRARRLEEVDILRALSPAPEDNVVNLIEAWESNGYLYIMTEFCENGNLDSFLDELGTRLDEWRVWKIMGDVSHGLRFIHDRGYCHLDLKPANVFITFDGSLKIGDFGMATKLPAAPGVEREGDREYIAPEVLSHGQYGKPADVFSFGIMMVETAANIVLPDNGEHWHKLRSGDLSEAGRLSSSDLTSLGEDGPPAWAPYFMVDNSHALDSIVRAMISPQPEQRPTVAAILSYPELLEVEARRQAGATIYEGDFGPAPELGW